MVRKGGYFTARDTVPSYKQQNGVRTENRPGKDPGNRMSDRSSLLSKPGTYLDLNQGDMVEHTAFGTGMVLSVLKMSGDALLEIAFDKIGTKKLMAKTASAHMKKL